VKVKGIFFFLPLRGVRGRETETEGSSMTSDDRVWWCVVDFLDIVTCRVEQGSCLVDEWRDQRGELRSAVSDCLAGTAGWLWDGWMDGMEYMMLMLTMDEFDDGGWQ
jgi:hypothetical protein